MSAQQRVEEKLRAAFPGAHQIPSQDCAELRTKLPHFYHDDLVQILPAVLLDLLRSPRRDFLDSVVRFLCGRNLPFLKGDTKFAQAQKELNDFVHWKQNQEDPFIRFTAQQASAIAEWLKLASTWDEFLDKEELSAASSYWNGRC